MTTELGSPIDIIKPACGSVPVVLSSPHSGQIYPPCFLQDVRLNMQQLRRLEDAFVDRLFDTAPGLGIPLLRARFARAFVDANREAYEFDAEMFDDVLPGYANAHSAKAKAGLGTIPSRVGGQVIYRSKLGLEEAERRIRMAYWPYHHALRRLINESRAQFGSVLLLDCHSMPSFSTNGVLMNGGDGDRVIDFALGDRFGRSCAPAIVHHVEAFLQAKGFKVARNRPYAGGYITAHYGQPENSIHALQIEVRRGLYMSEKTMSLHDNITELKTIIQELLAWLVDMMSNTLQPKAREDLSKVERR